MKYTDTHSDTEYWTAARLPYKHNVRIKLYSGYKSLLTESGITVRNNARREVCFWLPLYLPAAWLQVSRLTGGSRFPLFLLFL